jgi:toxin YoeB
MDVLNVTGTRANLKAVMDRVVDDCVPIVMTRQKGKPEPLKGELKGWWSRRLTQEDRLVYRISGTVPDQAVEIIQCRSHSWPSWR